MLAQAASSFVNRVSPANVGGMALNARYLQKSGVEASAGVAAVGVNGLAGAVVHLVLIVVFFAWSGRDLAKAFKLPSGSKLLLILAVVVAIVGIVLATRPGRRFAAGKLIPGLRSAAASLRRVAQSPGKMIMLFGGSALITLAYIGALAASVQAFGGGPGVILVGAVYLGAAALAAAAPSPGGLGAIEAALVAGLTGVGMAGGTRRFRRAAVPAGHLLAAGGARLAVLARSATAGVRMKPRAVLRAACIGLAVAPSACTSSRGHAPSAAGKPAGRHGAVITVGSFDFPESVLLAEIYGQALAAGKFPVRILPNLGPRELVDPALMDGLVQLVPEYAGSALEFFSLGRLPATSDAGAANRALAGSVAGRGLVAARPAPAQDANAIVVTAATAARYGLRSIADLARVAPRPGVRRPARVPGTRLLPARAEAGLRAALQGVHPARRRRAADPAGPGGGVYRRRAAVHHRSEHPGAASRRPGRRPRAAAGREHHSPGAPGCHRPLRPTTCVAVLNRVSALLDTGTLRALDARVELAGQNPRLVAGSWLRAHGLIPAGGDVR